jgi:predicted dehydrogenase
VKSLVIGYGSIGARHAHVLGALDCDTAVVSRRRVEFPAVYADLTLALREHRPDYVVIANPTYLHHATLGELAASGFAGRVLVEKPLFDLCKPVPVAQFQSISVGYNLRFHPVIRRLKELASSASILSVHAHVGQYLPEWRSGADYRQSYSAKAALGGGALRDLSHELDYLAWIFGDWKTVTALGGHVSALDIDSDDIFSLLMQTDRCPVMTIQMNYLDRVARRQIVVNTQDHTIEADLIRGTLSIDGHVEKFDVKADYTYREMHCAALKNSASDLCSIDEGLATLQLIEAAERANQRKEWVTR